MKNSKINLFALTFVVVLIGIVFWYSKNHISATHNADQPKIVYAMNYFDLHWVPVRKDIHAVNLDGANDKVIYSTANDRESVQVMNHAHVSVSESSPEATIQKFFDKNGKSVKNIYENFPVVSQMYRESGYSTDGENVATFQWKPENLGGSSQIKTLNLSTHAIKEYPCSVCGGQNQKYTFYQIHGWSADNAKIYFSISRDEPPTRRDSEPNNKYFSLDVKSGNINSLPLSGKDLYYYDFYPQYGVIVETVPASLGHEPEAVTSGSIKIINLNDFSERFTIDSLPLAGSPIFNGKYLVYNVLSRNLEQHFVRSINVETKEQRDILPVNLVNTAKTGGKDLFAFLPNSNTFLYQVEYDNGWELRTHNIETGEDRSILLLAAEKVGDGTFIYRQYLGVIF